MTWLVVALLTLGAAGQRLIGMYVVGTWLERRPVLHHLADLLPAAIVSALVVQLSFATAGRITIDARAAGITTAAVLIWRKAPFVLVVVGAAAVTAAVRAVAGGA